MSDKNIDSLLMQQSEPAAEPVTPKVEHVEKPVEVSSTAESSDSGDVYGTEPETKAVDSPAADKETAETDGDVDEYGNKASKSKMYSEEEVQRMIRDRLSRGQQQATPQQVQQAADDFIPDANSDDSWETQLESFIEKTISKKQTKAQQLEWKRQEEETQAHFEAKFNAGMSKYSDFQETIAGKPITDAMMMAARALDNPAAFIYAACKLQPKEIEKIAALRDPYQQATAIGRLEEKMRKAKSGISTAAKPITNTKGDMPSKGNERRSVDDLIRLDAKRKFAR
jgi:hypothetical protein